MVKSHRLFSTLAWFLYVVATNGWFFSETITNHDLIRNDPENAIGKFSDGNMVIIGEKLIVKGADSIASFKLDLTDLMHSSNLPQNITMVNDLQSRSGFVFASVSLELIASPDEVHYLIPMSEDGIQFSDAIPLSQSIFVGFGSGIFHGFGYVLIADTESEIAYRIDTSNGNVEETDYPNQWWQSPSNWAVFGQYENSNTTQYITYATSSGKLQRQNTQIVDDFSEKLSNSTFGSSASYVLDAEMNHWYVYYEGFGGKDNTSFSQLIRGNIFPLAPSSQPTSSPSQSPSVTPSSMPTISLASPKVVHIVSQEISSSMVALIVTLDANSRFAGNVYCNAFYNESFSPTLNDIVNGGVSMPFAMYEEKISLSLANLLPLSTYAVYCATSNILGYSSSLSDVLSTKTSVATSCCFSISFTNHPAAVYVDTSKYSTSSPIASYVFSFRLSSRPKTRITVIPFFSVSNDSVPSTITNSFMFSPSSFLFTPSSTVLDASFVIANEHFAEINSTISGILNLNISGSSDFVPEAVSVSILCSSSLPSPPVLSSVRMGDSGQDMFIRFDSNTDYASFSKTSSWNCFSVFHFLGAQLSTCNWLNASTIYVTLPTGATNIVEEGNPVFLLGNKVRAECNSASRSYCLSSYPFSLFHGILVSAPYNPIVPQIVLHMPSSVSTCGNLTLDAVSTTGSGGRSWKNVQWTVFRRGSMSTMALQSYLASFGNSLNCSIEVPISLLSPGEFMFSLRVTNHLNKVSSLTKTLYVHSDIYVPQVTLEGMAIESILSKNSLSILSSTTMSSCSSLLSISLHRSWTLMSINSGKVVALSSSSVSPSKYILAPYSLSPGNTYILTINVTSRDSVSGKYLSSSTAAKTILVSKGSVHAKIEGASTYSLGLDSTLTLDGASSYDDDSQSKSALSYTWMCTVTSLVYFGQDCSTIFFNGTSQIASRNLASVIVYGHQLVPNVTYSIRLQVSSSDGRYSVSSTVIIYSSAVRSLLTFIASTANNRVNFQDGITLYGSLSALPREAWVFAQWTAYIGNDMSNSSVSIAASSPVSYYFDSSTLSQGDLFSLVLNKNAFPSGISVTFRLAAGFVASTNLVPNEYIFSEVSLIGNNPPSQGELTCIPAEGYALTTLFTLSASYFSDDISDYPLTYVLGYRLSSSRPISVLRQRSLQATVAAQLPAGLQRLNYTVYPLVMVFDSLNAQTTVSTSHRVYPLENEHSLIIAAEQLLDQSFYLESDTTLQLINMVATSLSSVDCSALSDEFCISQNRAPCESTANTCGSCLDGYLGVFGDSNLPCVSRENRRRMSIASESNKLSILSSFTCNNGSDCPYGACIDGECAAASKTCTSSSPNTICSGHGSCIFLDGSMQTVSSCTVNDPSCFPLCVCELNYGGKSCEWNGAMLQQRDALRGRICNDALTILLSDDPSYDLVQSISSLMVESISPYDTFTLSSLSACENSLLSLMMLANNGYLSVTDNETADNLVSSVSNMLFNSALQPVNSSISAMMTILQEATAALLRVQNEWQHPTSYSSERLRILVVKELANNIGEVVYFSPQTLEMVHYGVDTSSLRFSDSSAYSLDSGNGFAKFALVSFGVNPFHRNASINLQATPLWISTSFHSKTTPLTQRKLQADNSSSSIAYYFSLPFLEVQSSLNLSYIIQDGFVFPMHNETFPVCREYDTNSGEYILCDSNCAVVAYTYINVTFGCKSIADLTNGNSEILTNIDDYASSSREYVTKHFSVSFENLLISSTSSLDISVLSENFFALDFGKAKEVIVLMGSLLMAFVLGGIVFIVWDENDKHTLPLLTLKGEGAIDEKHKAKRNKLLSATSNAVSQFKVNFSEFQLHSLYRFAENNQTQFSVLKLIVPDCLIHFSWSSLGQIILQTHPLFSSFFKGSFSQNRGMRWFHLYRIILLVMAVTTAIFYVFFPSNNFCESHSTLESCESRHNYITSQSTCHWSIDESNNSHHCSLRLPPTNHVVFRVMLALVTAVVVLPIDFITSYIIDECCAKVPDSSSFYSNNKSHNTNESDTKESAIAIAKHDQNDSEYDAEDDEEQMNVTKKEIITTTNHIKEISKRNNQNKHRPTRQLDSIFGSMFRIEIEEEEVEEAKKNSNEEEGMLIIAPPNEMMKRKSSHLAGSKSLVIYEDEGVSNKRQSDNTNVMKKNNKRILLSEFNLDKFLIVHDEEDVYHSIEAETSEVMRKIGMHFAQTNTVYTQLHSAGELAAYEEMRVARMEIIRKYFGISSLGGQEYRSLLTRFKKWFRQRQVMDKIEHIRDKTEILSEMINTLHTSQRIEKNEMIDHLLLTSFILEQLPSLQRWIISNKLSFFSPLVKEKVNLYVWLSGWLFTWFTIVVYIAWIFYWSLLNQQQLLTSWGWNIGIVICQDMLFVQVLEACVFYVMAIYCVTPSLQAIYLQLEHMAISVSDGGRLPLRKRLGDDYSFNVIQHVSPVVRASRQFTHQMTQYEKDTQNNDYGMCRLLNALDDCDVIRCRQPMTNVLHGSNSNENKAMDLKFSSGRENSMLVQFGRWLLLPSPMLLFLFGENAAEAMVRFVLLACSSGAVIGGLYLYKESPYLLIAPVGMTLVFYLWQYHLRAWVKSKMNTYEIREKARLFHHDVSDLHMIRARSTAQGFIPTLSLQLKYIRKKLIGQNLVHFLFLLSWDKLYQCLPWVRRRQEMQTVTNRWQKMCIPQPSLSSVLLATFAPSVFEEDLHVDSPLLSSQYNMTASVHNIEAYVPNDTNHSKFTSFMEANGKKISLIRKLSSHISMSVIPSISKVESMPGNPVMQNASLIPLEISQLVKTSWQDKVAKKDKNHTKAVDTMLLQLNRDLFGTDKNRIYDFAISQYRIGEQMQVIELEEQCKNTKSRLSFRAQLYLHMVQGCTTVEDALLYMVEQYVLYHFPFREDHDRLAQRIFANELQFSRSSLASVLQSIWSVYNPQGKALTIDTQKKILTAFYQWSKDEEITRIYPGEKKVTTGIMFECFEVWFQRIMSDDLKEEVVHDATVEPVETVIGNENKKKAKKASSKNKEVLSSKILPQIKRKQGDGSFSLGGLNLQSFHRQAKLPPSSVPSYTTAINLNNKRRESMFMKRLVNPLASTKDIVAQYLQEIKSSAADEELVEKHKNLFSWHMLSSPSESYCPSSPADIDANNADVEVILNSYRRQEQIESNAHTFLKQSQVYDAAFTHQKSAEQGYSLRSAGAINPRLQRLSSFHSSMDHAHFMLVEIDDSVSNSDQSTESYSNTPTNKNDSSEYSRRSSRINPLSETSATASMRRVSNIFQLLHNVEPSTSNTNAMNNSSDHNILVNNNTILMQNNPLAMRRGSAILKSPPLATLNVSATTNLLEENNKNSFPEEKLFSMSFDEYDQEKRDFAVETPVHSTLSNDSSPKLNDIESSGYADCETIVSPSLTEQSVEKKENPTLEVIVASDYTSNTLASITDKEENIPAVEEIDVVDTNIPEERKASISLPPLSLPSFLSPRDWITPPVSNSVSPTASLSTPKSLKTHSADTASIIHSQITVGYEHSGFTSTNRNGGFQGENPLAVVKLKNQLQQQKETQQPQANNGNNADSLGDSYTNIRSKMMNMSSVSVARAKPTLVPSFAPFPLPVANDKSNEVTSAQYKMIRSKLTSSDITKTNADGAPNMISNSRNNSNNTLHSNDNHSSDSSSSDADNKANLPDAIAQAESSLKTFTFAPFTAGNSNGASPKPKPTVIPHLTASQRRLSHFANTTALSSPLASSFDTSSASTNPLATKRRHNSATSHSNMSAISATACQETQDVCNYNKNVTLPSLSASPKSKPTNSETFNL